MKPEMTCSEPVPYEAPQNHNKKEERAFRHVAFDQCSHAFQVSLL
jgi:hypothetical protein